MFNKKNRTTNSIRNSVIGVSCQIITILIAFIYRVLFLKLLSEVYLGLDGLFTNILGVLSLAEMGFGSAIAYRLYKHIKDEDVEEIGALVAFYRKIYLCIASIIFVAGLAIMPFLKYLIADTSAVPTDINIYLLFFLFLFQSVSTYLFSYKFILLDGDQKNHILTLSNLVMNFVKYSLQILILYLTRNFLLTIIVAICVQIVTDIIMSTYVRVKYKEVFAVKKKLSKDTKKQVFKETAALMCHKVGGIVVNSTDNILISSFVGLAILGAYSNYSLIIVGLTGLINKLFSSIGASIGNLHVSQKEREEEVYKKLIFLNLFVVSICTILYFALIQPFIVLAFGENLALNFVVILVLSLNFYLSNSKIITNLYIFNCGLFVKDKIRPLIEATINLVASILFVKLFGLAGIFLGTMCGVLCTVFWREPYLLYKYEFKMSAKKFWAMQLVFFIMLVVVGGLVYYVCQLIPNSIGYLFVKAILALVLSVGIYCLCFHRTKYFKYFAEQLKNVFRKIFKKKESKNAER